MESTDYRWIFCPVCKGKTHEKITKNTVLENFPLFCPKCKRETMINVKNLRVTIIEEPAAKPQS